MSRTTSPAPYQPPTTRVAGGLVSLPLLSFRLAQFPGRAAEPPSPSRLRVANRPRTPFCRDGEELR
ncbi:hypothetical protein [Streptomyces sp. SID11385]|uniref:hypothetical protein n=1 Tax=Streptomyces sp. SID11385 TaxID=2706031 RepID=UPI0013C81901|nr:hypothetical protein [Streptomyces sp. SID11385]NEA43392.1 hypothetical protein [Streptomyces sp. SID11385]